MLAGMHLQRASRKSTTMQNMQHLPQVSTSYDLDHWTSEPKNGTAAYPAAENVRSNFGFSMYFWHTIR